MEKLFERFVSDKKGAVSVDWAILLLGVASLTIAIYGTLTPYSPSVAEIKTEAVDINSA